MHVMKDQYNIALITGAPNYNTRLIKKHLNNGNNKIDHFVYRDKEFIPNLKKFWEKKYEVVIFDNNPVLPEPSLVCKKRVKKVVRNKIVCCQNIYLHE